MSNTPNPTHMITGRVRISYEHLTKPYANQQNAEPKFSASLLIPKTDIATKQKIDAAINAAIADGISNTWKGARPPQMQIPVWDGDGVRKNGEAFGAECKGCWVITASSKQRPEIVDLSLNPILDATQIYSGMYARVSIRMFAFDSNGNRGIGCGLGNVQKLEDGEPLGGRTTAADDFGGGVPAYQPAAPAYPQYGQAPNINIYPPLPAAPVPAYPVAPAPTFPSQPQPPYYPQPAGYQPPAPQIDPITGRPIVDRVLGL